MPIQAILLCEQLRNGDAKKSVFGISGKGRLKPVSLATETSKKFQISLEASLDMILYKKRITKALIRLRECAGWFAPLLFANLRRQVFSRRGPYDNVMVISKPTDKNFYIEF